MLDELETLAAKLTELSGRVRQLREENQMLRTQVAAAQSDLHRMNARVAQATERIDALLERLPEEAAAKR
jgi:outer membrane murein-binding lipoprotein Lpp